MRPEACVDCDRPMVSGKARTAPGGHVRHQGRGLCRACWSKRLRDGSGFPERLQPQLQPSSGCQCAVCEDVRWLAETGEWPERWPARTERSTTALVQRLRRHGEVDLARQIERVRRVERKELAA